MSKKVLIVDDSLYMQAIIKDALEEAGYNILGTASDGESAIDQAIELQPDIITLDNILLVSAVGQQSVINTGISLGADGYLVKPFTSEQLLEKLKEIGAA